jgi:hypothetical protein
MNRMQHPQLGCRVRDDAALPIVEIGGEERANRIEQSRRADQRVPRKAGCFELLRKECNLTARFDVHGKQPSTRLFQIYNPWRASPVRANNFSTTAQVVLCEVGSDIAACGKYDDL